MPKPTASLASSYTTAATPASAASPAQPSPRQEPTHAAAAGAARSSSAAFTPSPRRCKRPWHVSAPLPCPSERMPCHSERSEESPHLPLPMHLAPRCPVSVDTQCHRTEV